MRKQLYVDIKHYIFQTICSSKRTVSLTFKLLLLERIVLFHSNASWVVDKLSRINKVQG